MSNINSIIKYSEEAIIRPDFVEGYLRVMYDSPPLIRWYHNLNHVETFCEHLMSGDHGYNEIVAGLFHDIIYVPGSKTNEWDSIRQFRKIYDMDAFNKRIIDPSHVINLIEMTIDHKKVNRTPRELRFMQSDFANMYDINRYENDAKNIQTEYLTVCTLNQYKIGRRKFLRDHKPFLLELFADCHWLSKSIQENIDKEISWINGNGNWERAPILSGSTQMLQF